MPDPGTVPVRAGAERTFLKKSREFARGMEGGLAAGDANQAASDAAHCVICACDALMARRRGVRSRAKDHSAVVDLVAELELPAAREKAAQAAEVISLKHVAEYDDREVLLKDAERAVKQARRFLEWVEAALAPR